MAGMVLCFTWLASAPAAAAGDPPGQAEHPPAGVPKATSPASPGSGSTGAAGGAPSGAGGKSAGPDARREKQWANLLSGHLRRGRTVWLQAGPGHKVFAIYEADRTMRHRGGVILVHDMGQHPDWPRVVRPLRLALARHGWSTLSVQMPVLPGGQPPQAYAGLIHTAAPRLQAAVAYLKSRGITTVVLAGYGIGATMGAAYLAERKDSGVTGFIAVSMGNPRGAAPALDAASYLAAIKIPVLALYGSRDYEWVLHSVPRLAAAARRAETPPGPRSADPQKEPGGGGGFSFRQVEITGATHGYLGVTDELSQEVLGWMNRGVGRPPAGPQ